MSTLIVVTLVTSAVAGLAGYIVAYDRACNTGHRMEAGRYALRAIPGPSLFFLGLGTFLGIALPLVR
jgi:hypothetical protein